MHQFEGAGDSPRYVPQIGVVNPDDVESGRKLVYEGVPRISDVRYDPPVPTFTLCVGTRTNGEPCKYQLFHGERTCRAHEGQ